MWVCRWAPLWAAWIALAAACGGAQRATLGPRTLGRHSSGLSLSTLPRATPGVVQLSLFVDAGSRDADPPQIATAAAWLAASSAGRAVRARVFPDATELSLVCSAAQSALDGCVRRLARALSFRSPGPAAVARVRQRVARDRRSATVADPARDADRLALVALAGPPGEGLLPLGTPAHDSEIDSTRVSHFLSSHFAPSRAMLVAVGDITAGALEQAASKGFDGLPQASAARAERSLEAGRGRGVEVAIDQLDAASAAVATPDRATASAVAQALVGALRQSEAGRRIHGYAFTLRGQGLALVRIDGMRDLALTARVLGRELEGLRETAASDTSDAEAAPRDDLAALAQREGLRWANAGQDAARDDLALGLGALVRGGRGDRVASPSPDAADAARVRQRLLAALEAGRGEAHPELHGELSAEAASVTLDNGARIETRRAPGNRVAVAVRFGVGTAHEPPLLHGRAALLATLTSTACRGLPPATLETRLRALGATLAPAVDAGSWGLTLSVPAARFRKGLVLALGCALRPSFSQPHVTAARLRLLARLDAEMSLLGEAAQLLAPQQPGVLAPWGHPDRLPNVGRRELAELFAHSARGGGISVAVVGPLDAQETARLAARELSGLDSGKGTAPTPPEGAAAAPLPIRPPERYTRALAVWHVAGPPSDGSAAGARAFAAWVRASLVALPGVQSAWHAGGSGEIGTWAAVALSAPPQTLSALDATLAAVTAGEAPRQLEAAADLACDTARRSGGERAGSAAGEASRLARGVFEAAPLLPRHDAARAAAKELWSAEPSWRPLD